MSCLVKLFEPNSASPPAHVSLTPSSIELVAFDQTTLTNCCGVQKNAGLSAGGYGALLPFGASSIAYGIAIVDTHSVYGGITISSLSGTTAGDLDVVLDRVPGTRIAGAGGGTGVTATQVRLAVLRDSFWTPGEKRAVLSLIDALSALRGATTFPMIGFVHHYEVTLRDRGIDSALF